MISVSSLLRVALLPPDFWAQFWPDLAATLIGAFVGIWLALKVDHARDRKSREAQEAGLLSMARDAVQANLKLMAQAKPILVQGTQVPSFRMDVGVLDVVIPRLAEISPSLDLLGDLNSFRFQLHHVNRKLDHLLQMVTPPLGFDADVGMQQAVVALKSFGSGVLVTIGPLEKSGQDVLLPKLDARIASLGGSAEQKKRLP